MLNQLIFNACGLLRALAAVTKRRVKNILRYVDSSASEMNIWNETKKCQGRSK